MPHPPTQISAAMNNPGYSWRILGLSIVISLFAAGFVFLALQWLIVRPLRRLTEGLVAFRVAPEDASREPPPIVRRDEIGVAQAEFTALQRDLRMALRQRAPGRDRRGGQQDQPRSPQHPRQRGADHRSPCRQRRSGRAAPGPDPGCRHRPRRSPVRGRPALRPRGRAGIAPDAVRARVPGR
ncbi:MAG: HAMP domain-containing protein [Alphaproteobacteria bacterium]|nr:HAMP domain-containing protein [Alphaproteobacteria bacterium]